ncbi:pyridoxal phosphate-dependent aminotransferase [Pseudonocardia acaciae]|uniref:pyridoxal phosphate-dependent aminotransferase n=1 Tax=Pseudonocardia acaciae TaxID=551276 RepID=UPI00048E190E|nr:aminotransferase class I/II-fold pyridoxal phosphate-dependent enzyme [Pseudonocardia acaciae]
MTSPHLSPAHRVHRLRLPDRAGAASARDADRALLADAPADHLDTTHFDTVRFPPPDWALDAFERAARDGGLAYTGYRGHPDVLARVAEGIGALAGIPVDPDRNVVLTPGTQAALFATLSALVDDGDGVVLVDPDYLFSERILRFLGARVEHVRLSVDDGEPRLDLAALETVLATGRARVLVFSHPNNPTGAVYPPEVLARIAELATRYGLSVVVDELYCRLVYDDVAFTHLAALPGMRERVVTLFGPSKTESLSGYRLGVVVGPAGVMDGIEDVLSIMSLRAPGYAQHVLWPWLHDDHGWLGRRLAEFRTLRELTAAHLGRLPWLSWRPQGGTAYAWPDVTALGLPGPEVAHRLLREAGMLVSPGYQFGPGSAGHFRVCFARDERMWDRALERAVAVLDRLAREHGVG